MRANRGGALSGGIAMGVENGRKFERFPLRIPATLIVGRKEIEAVTENVSKTGLRLRTDAAPADRRLVQVRIALPPDGDQATFSAITTHASPAGGTRAPGVGVHLYGNGPELIARWERFLKHAATRWKDPAEAVLVAKATTMPLIDPVRRRFERVRAVLEVRYPSVDQLLPLTSRDVSMGGLFLAADALREVGDELGLEVVHPLTAERFPVRCVVRRVVREQALGNGMGVEFLDMDASRRAELWAFVTSGLSVLEAEDLEILAAPDEVVFELDFGGA
jgi:hypothetical protein